MMGFYDQMQTTRGIMPLARDLLDQVGGDEQKVMLPVDDLTGHAGGRRVERDLTDPR